MRKDKAINVAKVAKEVINNPLAKRDELANKLGLGGGTVSRALEELDENGRKDDRILGLTEKDFEIQNLVQKETVRRLIETPKEVRDNDLVRFGEFAMKRYQLFRGDPTERIEVQELDEERKAIIAKRYINV